jgi:zinc protease
MFSLFHLSQTTFDETVYKLEAPNNETGTLDLCFTVLRDWLDGALLEEQAIDDERGVILSEQASTASVNQRLQEQLYNFLIPDTLIVDRWPRGTEQSVKSMVPAEFKEFYQEYYTPQRATVVVTGDIDAGNIENLIIEMFANATNPENLGAEPDLGSVTPGSGFQAAVFTDDEFTYSELDLFTVKAFLPKPDTKETRKTSLSLAIANLVLEKRLNALGLQGNSPISMGKCDIFNLNPVTVSHITVAAVGGRLVDAVVVLEQELRRFVTYGLTQQEFDEAKETFLDEFQSDMDGARTRTSSDLADSLVSSVNGRSVFATPEENYAIAAAALAELTATRVHEDFLSIWQTEDISLVYLTKDDLYNSVSVLEAAFKKSMIFPVEPPMADGVESDVTFFAYTDFGEPGTVVSDSSVEDLEIRQLVLSNNVRVNLKQTKFEENTISMTASFGSGMLSQPLETDFDVFSLYVMNYGGLGKHSFNEFFRLLSGKNVDMAFSIEEGHFSFSGNTEQENLALLLQLMAAYLSDPGYREESVSLYRQNAPARLSEFEHTVEGPIVAFSQFLRGGDERYGIPTYEEMLSYEAEQVQAWLEDDLASSYLEVTIVGDFDDSIVNNILSTVGALPPRANSPDHTAYATKSEFPNVPQTIEYTYKSEQPQAQVIVVFETVPQTESNINVTRYLNVLSSVYDQRLFLEIREELGATYSPVAYSLPSSAFDYGAFFAYAITAPENVTVVVDRIQQIGDSLALEGVTEDDLLRAIAPILSTTQDDENTNEYWLSVLDNSQAYPYFLDWIRSNEEFYGSVTVEDVNEVAATYLGSNKSIVATMVSVDVDDGGVPSSVTSRPWGRHRFMTAMKMN